MRKIIYLAIIECLKASGVDIRHISLWNDNTAKLEEENGFSLPAVFVEFLPFKWSQRAQGVKSATMAINLHIVTETLADPAGGSDFQFEALETFDVIDSVVAAVQGLSGEGFNKFQHVETLPDHNHEQVQHDIEGFVCEATDVSAARRRSQVQIKDAVCAGRA